MRAIIYDRVQARRYVRISTVGVACASARVCVRAWVFVGGDSVCVRVCDATNITQHSVSACWATGLPVYSLSALPHRNRSYGIHLVYIFPRRGSRPRNTGRLVRLFVVVYVCVCVSYVSTTSRTRTRTYIYIVSAGDWFPPCRDEWWGGECEKGVSKSECS